MSSNKLYFACISNLIFLVLFQKGKRFFHLKLKYFNFQYEPTVILLRLFFLPLLVLQSCGQLLIGFIIVNRFY